MPLAPPPTIEQDDAATPPQTTAPMIQSAPTGQPPDMKTMLQDSRFMSLPATERHRFLQRNYPDYANLPPDEQRSFLMRNAMQHTTTEAQVGKQAAKIIPGVIGMGKNIAGAVAYRYNPTEENKAAADAMSRVVTEPYHELASGRQPDESAMTPESEPGPLGINRLANAGVSLLGGDTREMRAAKERGDPGAQVAAALTVPLLTAGFGRLLRGPKDMTVAPARSEISSLQSIAPRAVTGTGPAQAATRMADIQSVLKQVAHEQGMSDATLRRDLARSEHAPASDLVGDVGRGNQRVFDLVKGAVDFTHRPIDAIMTRYGKQPAAGVPQQVAFDLRTSAAQIGKVNPALSKAMTALADKAFAAKTFGELNDIKVHANKMADDLYSPIPGRQINASAESAFAYRKAADAIRARMYPALEKASGGSVDLAMLGRREADAISFRDGLMEHYYSQVAPAQANMAASHFLEYTLAGEGAPGHSYYTRHMAGRGLEKAGIVPGGGGKMNKAVRRGIGPIGEGITPESVDVTPRMGPPPAPNPLVSLGPGAPGMAGTTRSITVNGQPAGHIIYDVNGATATVHHLGGPNTSYNAMSNTLGPQGVTQIVQQLQNAYPNVTHIQGIRVGGAQGAAARTVRVPIARLLKNGGTLPPGISITPYEPGMTPRGWMARNKGNVAGAAAGRASQAGLPPPPIVATDEEE